MKRDTLFYRIFQQCPTLLFDLLPTPPPSPQDYTFESIEVKETSFRIDGVLIPTDPNGRLLFSEVQMQPDPKLYERLFSEIGIYTYRNHDRFADWQALVIYPSLSIAQSTTKVPHELFESGRIQLIYLDQLGPIESLPLGLGLLVLTILEGDEAITQSKRMMERARRLESSDAIMELVSTVMIYKFTNLNRDEVYAMLSYTIDELKQTRIYREAKEEERLSLILSQLNAKLGPLSPQQQSKVQALPFDRLQALTIALLNFADLGDMETWIAQQPATAMGTIEDDGN
jgi:predicted transposase/invertase (TIGR01784 family)